jgi:PST family polysaccharide transporter
LPEASDVSAGLETSRPSGGEAGSAPPVWTPGPDGMVIARNVGWMFGDRVFRLIVGLVINVWMIRTLGPDDLGLLGFSQSLVGLFAVLSQLGLEAIVVRELVRHPDTEGTVLGTSFFLRLTGAVATLALSASAMLALRPGNPAALAMALVFSGVAVAQTLDVIEYWFQSHSKVAPFVLARSAAFVLASIAKVACLVAHAPLETLALAIGSEFLLAALGLALVYRLNGGSLGAWRFSRSWARRLLSASWPLLVSSLAVVLYTRTDQVMLTLMRGEAENGIYAAAQRLSEILYFIPVAVLASSNATLLRSHQEGRALYERRLGRMFTGLAWAAILMAVPISVAARPLVTLLFGSAFTPSGTVLALHVWAAPAVFLGVAQTSWFIAEGRERSLLGRTLAGAVTNIALNAALIPRFGASGAAAATLISQWLASVLLNSMFASTRPLFRLQCRAFLPLLQR